MSKDPAFLLYSNDWLQGTSKFFPAEKGIYIDLLCHQHQDGFLPIDVKLLSRICGLGEIEFAPLWANIKTKFHEVDGKLYNKKLIQVTSERAVHSEMRSIIGTFGQLLKGLDISDKKKSQLRSKFNYRLFLSKEKQTLSKDIAEWVANALANRGVSHEDVIEDEDEDINSNNTKSKEEQNKLQKYIIDSLPNVRKLKLQLNFRQSEKLVTEYDKKLIKEVLDAMENHKELPKKYNSVYLTIKSWITNRKDGKPFYKNYTKPESQEHSPALKL